MRKIKIGLMILSLFISTNIVKADTIINIQYGGSNYSEYYYLNNLNFTEWWVDDIDVNPRSCSNLTNCYDQAINYFSTSNYQYYSIYINLYPQQNYATLNLILFNFTSNSSYTQNVFSSGGDNITRFFFSNTTDTSQLYGIVLSGFSDPMYNNFYSFYDSNFNFINSGDYVFEGFYDNENNNYSNMLQIHDGDPIPKIKDLLQYTSWGDYESNQLENYTTVDLNNYEYVLLSLKNYSNVEAFQTNLQVKGQIGITPIYNYGQTSKDSITGVKVQDRCNISYQDYTSYPFYILQSDLQNNAIYAVKSCSSNSSFKFDSNIFSITYVTQENKDNPTVTINGKTYDVIPYEDLPSTATKNEEDNYIPGESGSANDTGGLDGAITGAQRKLSEIWNSITYFTSFIGQIFSSLPSEVHTILISAFTIMIMLGIIKIFLGK